MASIVHEFTVDASVERAWEALSDVGAVDKLITFLGPVTVDGDTRTVDMGEFGLIEELIVAVDAEHRRVAYSIQKSPYDMTYHHSSMQILPPERESGRTRMVWILDLKPDSLAEAMAPGVADAVAAIQKSLAD
jgi:carbon monoxide dehydrogenase subunit G